MRTQLRCDVKILSFRWSRGRVFIHTCAAMYTYIHIMYTYHIIIYGGEWSLSGHRRRAPCILFICFLFYFVFYYYILLLFLIKKKKKPIGTSSLKVDARRRVTTSVFGKNNSTQLYSTRARVYIRYIYIIYIHTYVASSCVLRCDSHLSVRI